MKSIIRYVRQNVLTTEESPFNRLDALAVSWLSYFNFPDCAKGESPVRLEDVAAAALPDGEMYSEAYNPKTSKKLFRAMAASPRFRNIGISRFLAEKDEVEEKQFAAVCIELAQGVKFLSFRGTDPSFMAWKEDFNLVRIYPLPSQYAAAKYARELFSLYPRSRFYLGGHSKGGTAAVYAAMSVGPEAQKRIVNVFNFDGPGFLKDVYSDERYRNIAERTVKIVPQSSFVGQIMERRDDYLIVQSRTFWVLQHDPFSWKRKGNDFRYAEGRTKGSAKFARAFNDWIDALSDEERERFTAIIFNALNTLDTKSFTVFFKTLYRHIPKLHRQYRNLSEEDKAFFGETLGLLHKQWKKK